jgi:hypothetical protein
MGAELGMRAVRAAMFAAICVLLAAFGHTLMSGSMVPWWTAVGAFVVLAEGAWLLTERERGIIAVTSATVVVQGVLHGWFSFGQATARPPMPSGSSIAQQWAQYLLCTPAGAAPMSASDAERVVSAAGLASHLNQPPPALHAHALSDGSMAGMAHTSGGMAGTGMLVAHLVAAFLCGLWLAYGERATFRILRAAAGWFLLPLRLIVRLPLPEHRPRIWRDQPIRPLRRLLLVHAITSRGPPLRGLAVV